MNELIRAVQDQLAPVAEAKRVIARAVADGDVDTLVELRERASAYELYHERNGAKELANDAGEIKVRAERGLGQIDSQHNPQGRPAKKPITPDNFSLSDIRTNTRAAWRKLGKLREETFAGYIDQLRADENAAVSTAGLIGIIRLGGSLGSTTFECYTPAEYVEAARAVMGQIDLDPASSVEANETIKAIRIYTADDDGLEHEWKGRVWLNPPYGRSMTAAFVTKLVEEYSRGNVTQAIVLLNAYGFDAAWFRPLWDGLLCFTDHRIKFYGGGPTFGSLFVYLGRNWGRFCHHFNEFGPIVRRT